MHAWKKCEVSRPHLEISAQKFCSWRTGKNCPVSSMQSRNCKQKDLENKEIYVNKFILLKS